MLPFSPNPTPSPLVVPGGPPTLDGMGLGAPPTGPQFPMPTQSPLALMDMLMSEGTGMGMDPGFDIGAAMQDPEFIMQLMMLMEGNPELQNGPNYPKWFRPADYPEPTVGDVQMRANQDRELYRLLMYRWESDRLFIENAIAGVFKDDKDPESDVVPFFDSAIALDVQLIKSLLSAADIIWEAKARKSGDQEEAEHKEDFAQFIREGAERRHYNLYGTDLTSDEIMNELTYGHLCVRRLPVFDAESDEPCVEVDLMDIATVFPERDKHGIRKLTRIYTMNASEIVSTWDRDGSNTVANKLYMSKVKGRGGTERECRPSDDLEVYEYWNRMWMKVVVNGIEVYKFKHRFGFVPFVYVRTPLGNPGHINPNHQSGTFIGGQSARQRDLSSKGLSHVALLRKPHQQREAILARMLTEVKKASNPDRTFEQDLSIYGETPDVTNQEGGISLLRAGYEREVTKPPATGFEFIPPMMGAVNESMQRGLMPASTYGVSSNANESGAAMYGMNQSGYDKLTPHMITMQMYHRECAEMDLTFFRDWGHLMGSDGQKGTMIVPRRKTMPGDDPFFELTPDIVKAQGVKMNVRLFNKRLQDLGRLGAEVAQWMNMGLMERTEALELRGVRDPIAAERRLKIEEFEQTDEYKKASLIEWLESEGKYRTAAIVQQLMQQEMLAQQMGGMMGGGGGGSPMGGQQPPGIPGMAQAMGGPVGQMGGGPGGPQPGRASPMQGSMGPTSQLRGPLPGPPPGPGGIPPGGM